MLKIRLNHEIKFRGKDTETGEWRHGCLHWHLNTSGEVVAFIIEPNESHRNSKPLRVDPATTGQSTGRRDKRGTEIYQGDILEFRKPGMKPYHRAVMWHTGGLHLICELGGFPDNDDDFGWLDHAHVAGTVHDNSDLLDVAK